ncbi:PIN-like domain-containing protein [Ensifer sp. ENS12]|uniref:PIN-like domain-containing protein n=1 Tax=Ensifer sp. ENS12 TaxID=2854774 RepID=UPI001C491906|nr:PIN-like domain-containing protein [Ensifer sp. ENS12]MBV7522332.1 DUF4935 domain-containing protein [Ensifer sp. ENS12]
MKSAFSEFYKPTDDELKVLWKESLFVIDANVVLNLYRYPGTVRDDLLKSLHNVADRLWMPYQAAYEYQRKRLDVIAEQKKAFDTVKNELKNSVTKMQALFSARHPLIEQGTLVEQVGKLVDEYVGKLQPLSDKQPAVHDDDNIREKVDELLNGKVGPEPSKEDVEGMCADGHDRYERKIPPGFMDAKKEDVHHFRGIRYEARFGDLLLWRQVLEHAKSIGSKSLIFITDDTKEDWWQIVSGKTIGPLPALKAEIKSVANVENFHMYTTENFLRYSEHYFKTKIDPQTIDQVAKINEATSVLHYYPKEILRERFKGDSYLIETTIAGSKSRAALRNSIQSCIQSMLPFDTFHIVDRGGDIELYTMVEDFNDEVANALISLPGVASVRLLTSNKRWAAFNSNLIYATPDENVQTGSGRLFDLNIMLGPPEDIDPNQVINWIKMVLNKELQAVEPREMRRFSTTPFPNGLAVTIHIPLLYRDAQSIRTSIAVLEGVDEVQLVEASKRGWA